MTTKKLGLIALFACAAVEGALAQGTFTNYANGDVIIGFRNGKDMVVDAGPISNFTSLTNNQRYSISTYTTTQIGRMANVNGSPVNGAYWSAFTYTTPGYTLYVTRPRTVLNVQSQPWVPAGSGQQQSAANRMALIPGGAVSVLTTSNNGNLYNSSGINHYNTPSVVVEPDNNSGNNAPYYVGAGVDSYNDAVNGKYGTAFNGNFQGSPENYCPSQNNGDANDFSAGGVVERSDFYQLTPSASAATYLGYFELNTNGLMTYVAYPTGVPVILSLKRSGTTTTINYTTGVYGTYTLRETNVLVNGTSPTNWPAVTTLSSGDNNLHTVTDTTTDTQRFYTITAK
jgi:hypothetical protein